jgi:hypothetical protein
MLAAVHGRVGAAERVRRGAEPAGVQRLLGKSRDRNGTTFIKSSDFS